ncbi:MAG: RIP metalloprotease RseP [Alphaproteobacteria bacterium]|nr:RIP metalloprotease RseP [Alphaproteobacteria bacterium]
MEDLLLNIWNMALVPFWNNVIVFLIVLSLVVFVHEFGHFIIARMCGVHVEAFSLGFGKELWGRTDRYGTRWKLCPIPLGGYCKMFGDSDPASCSPDEKVKEMSEADKAKSFWHKPLHQRFAIVAAGPLTNYLFGIILFAAIFVTAGLPMVEPVVDEVMKGSAAEEAGIQIGDRVIEINGEKIKKFEQIRMKVLLTTEDSVLDMHVVRDGNIMNIKVVPHIVETEDIMGGVTTMPVLGIVAVGYEGESFVEDVDIITALYEGVHKSYSITKSSIVALWQMITGSRSADGLGGPIQIASMSKDAASSGFISFVMFIAVISVNLGFVNLFPIPILDGGHLVFYTVEGIIRHPIKETVKDNFYKVGATMLIALMVFATWNDLSKVFSGFMDG